MSSRADLWDRWIMIEQKLKNMKDVIQNEIEMSQDDLIEWLKDTIEFKVQYDLLVRDTGKEIESHSSSG